MTDQSYRSAYVATMTFPKKDYTLVSLPPQTVQTMDACMRSAFDKIAAGLKDAIAYSRGDLARGRIAAATDVRAVRTTPILTKD